MSKLLRMALESRPSQEGLLDMFRGKKEETKKKEKVQVTDDRPITEIWKDFEKRLKRRGGNLVEQLRPPATVEDLAKLVALAKGKLSQDYLDILKIHDGQGPYNYHRDNSVFGEGEFRFMSIADILGACQRLLNPRQYGIVKGDEAYGADKEQRYKYQWWNKNWIPFAAVAQDEIYCVFDLDPDVNGTGGQILYWARDDRGPVFLMESNFKQWFLNENFQPK